MDQIGQPEYNEVLTVVLYRGAGSETTATALSGLMYFILTNDVPYRKLVSEIRGAFKSHKDITWDAAKELPYLGACIYEAMRMFPPVPANLNRVVPPEGAFIDGKWVAGEVSVPTWARPPGSR